MTTTIQTTPDAGALVDAAPSTNIGQALIGAGTNFGLLIGGIGDAVAAAQRKLTENSADTISELAATMVDVIAVQETIYNDGGTIIGSKSYTQQVPALNIFDAVQYDYTQVRVQASLTIDQIATATSSQTNVSTAGGNLGIGFSGAFGLRGGAASSSSSTSVATDTDRSTAVGRARMFSEMVPTPVIIPKPTQVVVGPTLRIIEGPITNQFHTDGTTIIGRTIDVTVELVKKDGTTPIPKKVISIDTNGTQWSFKEGNATIDDGGVEIVVTDAAGRVTLALQRLFPLPAPEAPAADTTPRQTTLTARLGLISNSDVFLF